MSSNMGTPEIQSPFLLHPKLSRQGRSKPKVLIAEDELMIADMIEEILVEHGYEVCGIARTVSEGIALGRLHKPHLAVLDLRLADGGLGTEIAAELGRYFPIGVLYATGNRTQLAGCGAEGDACLMKPYRSVDLLRGLEIVYELFRSGKASRPYPQGFQLLPLAGPAPQAPVRKAYRHG
jgi:DNA-binding response OmpR family regulator